MSYLQISARRPSGDNPIQRKDFHKAITIRHLRIIAALADLKLVARVSEALHISQPAVSKQIAELERIVGVPVISRDKNRLHLTDIGLRLADHAKQVLNQLDRAAFDLDAMASGVSGSVSVGVVNSVAPTILPGAITLFKRSSPRATISVLDGHFVGLYPELEAGALDLIIARIWQPQELPGIEQMTLFNEPIVVVASRNHRLAAAQQLGWPDVVDESWILPQAGSIARSAVDTLFAENGLAPPRDTVSSLALALNLELLRQTEMLAFMPQKLAQRHVARGEIVSLALDTAGFLSEARCFWRKGQVDRNGTLSLFLKCLKKAADDLNTIPFG